ncbi:MAG: P-II family nitrogen regulator [Methanobacterium sp.]
MKNNILFLGASGSGKKTSLKHITEENVDIILFNYGKAIIGGQTTYFLSSEDYENFIGIEELLTFEIDGIIIFIDNKKGIKETDLEIMKFIDRTTIPYIIFSNKQDLCDSNFNIDLNTFIIPTIATEGTGIKEGFNMLLKLVKSKNRSMKDIVIDLKRLKDEKVKKPDISELANKISDLKKEMAKICKVKIFLHPIELDNVKEVLINAGFSNLTIIEIGYVESSTSKERYRGSNYAVTIPPRTEINIIIKYEDVKYILEALRAIKSDDIYNNLFISPIENVVRIRTKEQGEEAVE